MASIKSTVDNIGPTAPMAHYYGIEPHSQTATQSATHHLHHVHYVDQDASQVSNDNRRRSSIYGHHHHHHHLMDANELQTESAILLASPPSVSPPSSVSYYPLHSFTGNSANNTEIDTATDMDTIGGRGRIRFSLAPPPPTETQYETQMISGVNVPSITSTHSTIHIPNEHFDSKTQLMNNTGTMKQVKI